MGLAWRKRVPGPCAAMEGQGFYNAHSQPQQAAARLGLAFLAHAAEEVGLPPAGRPIVIADYGSAEGRNSLAPIRTATHGLRRRSAAPIAVVHVDRPGNDFSSLFRLLEADPESYRTADGSIFAYGTGGSFYDQLFPAGQVTLGWCSIALHWLGAVPDGFAGHAWPSGLAGTARAMFAQQAAADWQSFLRHRAAELQPGGRLVVVVPAADADGAWGLERLATRITAVLEAMVTDGLLREAELARMVVPMYNRSREELAAPFADARLGLVVEQQSLDQVREPLWEAFQASGDAEALARGYAGFARAAFAPTLAGALDPDRSPAERGNFMVQLEAKIRASVAADPAPLCAPVIMTMLIAKPA